MTNTETPSYTDVDPAVAEINGLANLIEQLGDADALHDSGAIDDTEYAERRAKRLAYTAAIASWRGGAEPDVTALLDKMREQTAQSTQAERERQETLSLLPDAVADLSETVSTNGTTATELSDAIAELSAIVSELAAGASTTE